MAICGLLLGLLATRGIAQEPAADLSLDIVGGITIPVGAAANVAGTGPLLAIGLNHRIDDRFSLVTEFHHSVFTDRGLRIVETTDVNLSRVSLGVEVRLTRPASHWRLRSRLAGGVTRVGTNPVRSPPGGGPTIFNISKINTDAFSLTGALQIDRRVGGFVPFVRSQVEVHFIGSNLGLLRGIDEEIGDSGPLVGLPIQLGLRFGL
ncbi:MAG: hypothetical protein ACODAA_05025 [Gemmatimonadota bacterium]